jgi:hypothetical protein
MVAVNGSDKELGLASDKPWSSASSPAEAQAIVIKTLQVGQWVGEVQIMHRTTLQAGQWVRYSEHVSGKHVGRSRVDCQHTCVQPALLSMLHDTHTCCCCRLPQQERCV